MPSLLATNKIHLVILLFVLVTGAVYGLTIRDGADWTEDYVLYILHGVNLAEGGVHR